MIWVVALLTAAAFLSVGYKHWKTKQVFMMYKYETTMTWSDGPDVKLSPESIKKLDGELDGIIGREAPGKNLHYPVASLDKRWVEVVYLGEQDVPEALRKKLDAYIQNSLPKLAVEQVAADQPH